MRLAAIGFALLLIASFVAFSSGYVGGETWSTRDPTSGGHGPHAQAVAYFSDELGPDLGAGHSVVARLSQDGMPLVTMNSLAFFRHQRRPDEVRGLVSGAIRRATAHFGANRIVLVARRFGADALPLGLVGLPKGLSREIAGIVLISPARQYRLRASPADLFSFWNRREPVAPFVAALAAYRLICIKRADEQESLCDELGARGAHVITLPNRPVLGIERDALATVVARQVQTLLAKSSAGQQAALN